MRKIAFYLSYIFMITLLANCEKSPYVSKDVIQRMRDSLSAASSVNNICFIYNNDVYFLDVISGDPQKITNTPAVTKKEVRISHDLQKIAYLNTAGHPEIIDRNGNILAALTSYSAVKQMDWSNDDATLYMLIGNQFQYYGPLINHPAISWGGSFGSYQQVLSATLSSNNDLAFVLEYFDPINGYQQKLVLKKNDGSNTMTIIDNDETFLDMSYVKFSVHAQDLVLGYKETAAATGVFEMLELYTNMHAYPDLTVNHCTACKCKYPVYRSDKHMVVSAFNTYEGWGGNNDFSLSVYNVNDVTYRSRTEYNSSTSDLIVDWK